MTNDKIKQILIKGPGWIYATKGEPIIFIEKQLGGERTQWYKQGKTLWSSKYLIAIEFEN